jgi:hypothetical protein
MDSLFWPESRRAGDMSRARQHLEAARQKTHSPFDRELLKRANLLPSACHDGDDLFRSDGEIAKSYGPPHSWLKSIIIASIAGREQGPMQNAFMAT